jgi:dihydroorotase-like cyclic amidohydrolase
MSLETFVHKATAMPARVLGLADRGVLAEGKLASVVVFDPTASPTAPPGSTRSSTRRACST